MVSPLENALSGLSASATRLAVSAENVAGGRQQRVEQTQDIRGGVQTRIVPIENPAGNAPADLATELVEQQAALQTYKANAALVRVARDLDEKLLDTLA